MNYYMDTEFLEGTQEKRMFGIKYGQTKPTIDLISIALVAEDNREFYAISKDFNLKEAWNRFQYTNFGKDGKHKVKEYWIRENVLLPIFEELVNKWALEERKANKISCTTGYNPPIKFTYKNFRKLINKYGKTNKQIAEEIKDFIYDKSFKDNSNNAIIHDDNWLNGKPQFYGYFADYDWVALCWLFGKMIDLPKAFPMYCNDLKQEMDRKVNFLQLFYHGGLISKEKDRLCTFEEKLKRLKELNEYPKQTNSHNALADALCIALQQPTHATPAGYPRIHPSTHLRRSG